MATTANPPPGATPANGMSDPFITSATANSAAMRFAPFDTEQFSMYSNGSPSQAKRALEAHLKDTDRRLQDASRLGNTLVQQRKDLSARLKDLDEMQQDDEVPQELRKKLAELEKEYNEVGKESARAFLPKARTGSNVLEPTATPSALTGSGRESPTKMAPPSSRRQRNQPSNRVHDIEFATEISTSLLAQVRQLQAALAEKDEELKDSSSSKAHLEAEAAGMVQRIKQMDESEHRYKDENWNLEMRLQALEASFKESTDKEQRLTQNLKTNESAKSAAQRDLDDLKVSHERLAEEHATIKRQHEGDLHGLRRDVANHESEKSKLQKRIEELNSQNSELAKAVAYRWNQPSTATDTEFATADEDQRGGDSTPEHSEPASPVKGTPRHGMLESETLKSSLNHAHRMIQNLKNNIHREKTEKIELKRMLQDTRDELEARRNEGGAGSLAKKRRSDNQSGGQFRKPARPLGANRGSTTEILEDEPDWEDHEGAHTPSKSRTASAAVGGALAGAAGTAAFDHAYGGEDTESTDAAFETATEREGTTTDAFETGRESMGDDSDELTETESGINRGGTIRKVSGLAGAKPRDRRSFQSTASTEDEADEVRTPIQAQAPKYRIRNLNNKGSRRGRVGDLASDSPGMQYSPASSNGTPQPTGQTLGDELDALDDDSMEGTPSRSIGSEAPTPDTQRHISVEPLTPGREGSEEPEIGSPIKSIESPPPDGEDAYLAHQSNAAMLAHESAINKPQYADAGVMTEPWEPEPATEKHGLRERAGEVVGGALAGFGLGRFGRSKSEESEDAQAESGAPAETAKEAERPVTMFKEPEASTPVQLEQSSIVSQETEPISPPRPETSRELRDVTAAAAEPAVPLAAAAPLAVRAEDKENLDFSSIHAQAFEPQVSVSEGPISSTPLLPDRSSKRLSAMHDSEGISVERDGIPGTDRSRVGAGFFATAETPRSLDGTGDLKTEETDRLRPALGEISSNTVSNESAIPKPLSIKKPVADEGSQTAVSGDDIENMLKSKAGVGAAGLAGGALAGAAAGGAINELTSSPSRPSTAIRPDSRRKSIDGAVPADPNAIRTPRRPASSGSMRKMASVPPPLPENHTQKIVAAGGKVPAAPSTANAGSMGPPLMPASAYKQNRPRTPAEAGRTMSRDGTTPRAPRPSSSQNLHSPAPSGVSRRTSMSSFASELDERFNMQRGALMYPDGVAPATDPRMIQAITQTMIGEYLWKYTRKAGRSETSSTRHRRFFWVHPYTRTLYWSEKDPSTAGRDMLKAKSVAIDAVRVITDDNAYPPGLHRKSLIVVTPGREIVFTAPTSQRHETWFNALSYLLLRTEQEKSEAEDAINQEDIDEFNPGVGNSIRRSISRFTGTGARSQSRVSLSSYNSRTTRNSSPERNRAASSLAQRQSAAAARTTTPQSPPTLTTKQSDSGTATTRHGTTRRESNGRFSSLTSRLRGAGPTNRGRSGRTSAAGESGIYDASVAAESAEDLRKVIEGQEREADRLENVRACCDGKHDVGSLSRTGGRHGRHSHGAGGHSHAHPKAQPLSVSSRPRRGE
ncbi:uncharacterized protein LTR77_001625 [Saxophila tyrrhenica]|uniref:PH domain-containing protein n=1 Tax=Saxophila tyrrhenica TaxID=1690608 RepID=A0AAV9PQH7_9PEZI|nr:hypothetical protein LTR77_001625 [Saxophila tyrrhenica]